MRSTMPAYSPSQLMVSAVNPLMGTVPHRIIWSWQWLSMGCLLYLVQWGGDSPPSPLLTVPNVTAYPSTASVPITILLYNGLLLCGFNVPIKGLTEPATWVRQAVYDPKEHNASKLRDLLSKNAAYIRYKHISIV